MNHFIPVIVVSHQLGLSNASVTLNIYAHTTVDMQNEAAALMDELMTPVPMEIPQVDLNPSKEVWVEKNTRIKLPPIFCPHPTHIKKISKTLLGVIDRGLACSPGAGTGESWIHR